MRERLTLLDILDVILGRDIRSGTSDWFVVRKVYQLYGRNYCNVFAENFPALLQSYRIKE